MDSLAAITNGLDSDIQRTGIQVDVVVIESISATLLEIVELGLEREAMEGINISLPRGDSRTLRATVTDGDGVAVNIDDSSIIFSLKEQIFDTDYIFQKKNLAASGSDSEILIIDGPGGIFDIFILPADTQNIEIGTYEYDVQVTTVANKVYTVVLGEFQITEEVTRP